ncbi:MAG TPA: hypothetical protein VFL83_01530 [Anaeromyxobacter sp.]|nr:hypothetical protein [Anaeromyxobacter sp.]
MRRLLKWIEAALAAVAFAEEGDADTARGLVADAEREGAAPGGAPGSPPARRPAKRRSYPRVTIARLP